MHTPVQNAMNTLQCYTAAAALMCTAIVHRSALRPLLSGRAQQHHVVVTRTADARACMQERQSALSVICIVCTSVAFVKLNLLLCSQSDAL
jgi:hypothetical protein